ncbi:MAG TPA: hypothetical protein VFU11_05545 [Solirubrobacterales bacterium]|nr:hypothetical protein [Solirubrobacterales bacterium]
MTILTELYMREMSPTQFFEEIGGPSKESVRKHFEVLYKWGWLRRVRKRTDGPGRPGFVYRTAELAVIDEETWAEIPLSIRDAFTLQLMQQLSERWAMAAEGGTLDRRQEQVLSLFPAMTLDEPGWKDGLDLLGDCFSLLEHEQIDAKARLAEERKKPPILLIVALAGFESAVDGGDVEPILPPSTLPLNTRIPWTIRLAKVFGDPINLEMVRALNEEPMSPSRMEQKIAQATKQTYDRRCKLLVELGWATQVDVKTGGSRRGSREVFYRATSPAVSPDEAWAIIPKSQRSGASWESYRKLCELVFGAVKAGTFNVRVDRHLTWGTLLLDEIGFRQASLILRNCSQGLELLGTEADRRMRKRRGGSNFTFFVGGFQSPPLRTLPLWGDLGEAS